MKELQFSYSKTVKLEFLKSSLLISEIIGVLEMQQFLMMATTSLLSTVPERLRDPTDIVESTKKRSLFVKTRTVVSSFYTGNKLTLKTIRELRQGSISTILINS